MLESQNNQENYEVPMADEIDYSGTSANDYEVVDKEYQQERLGKSIEAKKAELLAIEQSLQELLKQKGVLENSLRVDQEQLAKWNF